MGAVLSVCAVKYAPLGDPLKPDMAGFWQRAEPGLLEDGPPALGLTPQTTFLFLLYRKSFN